MYLEDSDSFDSSEAEAAPQPPSKRRKSSRAINWKKLISVACRTAALKSPAASRAALARHRASIGPELVKILETVGGYEDKVSSIPLRESLRQGDVDTTQFLIAAGADVYTFKIIGAKSLDVTSDDACRALLDHHVSILTALETDPDALVSAASAHCAFLTAPKKTTPAPALSLHPYHLRPSFLWAPHEARCAVFKWARNAYVAQVAASSEAFVILSDDCAGDVFEYLEIAMTRADSLHFTTHGSSLEAQAWVREVLEARVAEDATSHLSIAAEDGNLGMVKDYLAKGANAEEIKRGKTPLACASSNGHTAVVEILLRAGAHVDAKDENEASALITASASENIAAASDHIAIVKLLLEAGADVDAKDDFEGDTSLMNFSAAGNATIVKLLLEAGANVNAKSNFDSTALMRATRCSRSNVVRILLEAGADMEAKDETGLTALMHAARYDDNVDVVEILLQFGADKEAKNDRDRSTTALEYAKIRRCYEIMALLKNDL